jgi:hypothetical protein
MLNSKKRLNITIMETNGCLLPIRCLPYLASYPYQIQEHSAASRSNKKNQIELEFDVSIGIET